MQSIDSIKGVGDKTAQAFRSAGLGTVSELIQFLPRTYEDYTVVTSISDLSPGNVVVRGRLSNISARYVRRGLHVTQAVLSDASGKVPITWFNQPYRAAHIKKGGDWMVAGEFSLSQRRYQIMNPSVRHSDEIIESGAAIVPIYRQIAGLKSTVIARVIEELRPKITMLPELLPVKLVSHMGLPTYADAMLMLHFPESRQDIEQGKARIAFQEMLELLYAAKLNKDENNKLQSWHIPFDVTATKKFVSELPFQLTADQRRAAWDIIRNFESGHPMNRLLQGDVGSGKTIVAGLAAFAAARQGYQTAFLAPTELLARQHAETLSRLLEPHNCTVGLLVGSLKKSAKDQLKARIADGSVAVTVGTHALIQESVNFHRLGFVVIDEQHRFGVAQRQKLLGKGHKLPHLLAMTATPIPRSLQLTMYGDLDVSILREKPAGRKPIITKIVSPVSAKTLFSEVDKEIENGRQVYVVCPLIEDTVSNSAAHSSARARKTEKNSFPIAQSKLSGKEPTAELAGEPPKLVAVDSELASVTAEYERLQKTASRHRRIGLLHGKLKADDKDRVMRQFAAHELDILVSTTVVEVGVDVPNATVMIIEGAERFGLAQLHQLRGRVGRSDYQSYCYLVPTESRQVTNARLKELEQSNDGFYLAERDLELRGPGEIYGHAQHGELNLQIARITDMQLVRRVRQAIDWAHDHQVNLLQYDGMRERVDRYRRLTTLN